MSHKSSQDRSSSDGVCFKSYPFEGIVRTMVRAEDSKVRLALSRKGHTRVNSNWHTTSQEAFECIQAKCRTMGSEVSAMSHKRSVEAGVDFIHPVYGLYRDGKAMSSLFKLSPEAWQAYASRHLIPYRL